MLAFLRGRTESWMQWIPSYKCCKDYIFKNFPCQLTNRNMCVLCLRLCVCACVPSWKQQVHRYEFEKGGADIWYACVLYHSWHEPKKVPIPNYTLFWSLSAIPVPSCTTWQQNLRQKCNQCCQPDEFHDPAFYIPSFSTDCSCVTSSKRLMCWENENIYQIFILFFSVYKVVEWSICETLTKQHLSLINHCQLWGKLLCRRQTCPQTCTWTLEIFNCAVESEYTPKCFTHSAVCEYWDSFVSPLWFSVLYLKCNHKTMKSKLWLSSSTSGSLHSHLLNHIGAVYIFIVYLMPLLPKVKSPTLIV